MTLEDVAAFHEEVFAPWVKALGIRIVEIGEGRCAFRFVAGDDTVRRGGQGGGVVCGQALSAAADTASVMALFALNGKLRPCTTVDLTTHFTRPLPEGEVEIEVSTVSNGRRMAVTRAEFRAAGSEKIAAAATCAFAYLDG